MQREKYFVPQYDEESLIFASLYSTKMHIEHLRFLLLRGKDAKDSNIIKISYEDMKTLGEDWKNNVNQLLNISFPVMFGSAKGNIHWLESVIYDDENEIFGFTFSNHVQNVVNILAQKYDDDYEKILKFCRLRTFFIYQYLKANMSKGMFLSLSYSEIKDVCNYEKENYPALGELKRAVLNKAVEEINTCLGWNIKALTVHGSIEFRRVI